MNCWILALAAAAWSDALALSYDDALQHALEHNADLSLAGADLRAAEGALLAERGVFDPTLSANLGLSQVSDEGFFQGGSFASQGQLLASDAAISWFAPTGTSASVGLSAARQTIHYDLAGDLSDFDTDAQFGTRLEASVSQALLRGFRMSYNLAGVRDARVARDEAEALANTTRQQTLALTAGAYWSLYSARRQAEIAQRTLAFAREEQRVVAAQIAAGKLANMEQARADALAVQAESALLDAQNAEALARDSLLTLMGESPGQPVTLLTAPADPTPLNLDEDAVVQTALANNPSLQALRLAEQNAADRYADARHGRLPQLDATASYGLNGYEAALSSSLGEALSGKLPEWSVGASLSVPLGNRALRGAASSAEAAASAATTAREAGERAVAGQVRAQVRALVAASSQVRLALANQTYANQTLAAEKALQEVGRAVQKDVLEAIANADTAAVAVEQARAAWLLAIVNLEQLKGSL